MSDNGTDGITNVDTIIVVDTVALTTTTMTQEFSVQFVQVLLLP